MTVRRMLLFLMLLFLGFVRTGGKEADTWTVEPFSGSLSGGMVTVTRRLWTEGPLTGEELEGPLQPETVFALRCLREEMTRRGMKLPEKPDRETAYWADFALPGQAAEAWLHENVWRFGLITEDQGNNIIRLHYVGTVHAAAMRALDMDLKAYLLFLRRMGQVRLLRNGQAAAWVFCVPEQEAVTFTLWEGAAWEISGDGEGWVIIAIRSGS